MATIVTKNSSTASAVPTTSDLVQGELAVNVTDKRIFTENASTQIVELGTNPSSITTATATVTGTLTANGTFASSNAVITGGSINSTPIGATTPSTIVGSTVTANTGFVGGLTGNVTGNLTGNVTGNVNGNLTGNVTGNVTASSGTTTLNDLVVNGTADFTNTKLTNITTPTVGTDAANKSYVDDTVAAVIDSAPAALDTLNELAAALGDDANFAGTVTTALATKLPLAGGTMTGAIAMGTSKITGLGNPTSAQDAATKTYVDTADALKLNLTGGTMSGAIAMGTNKITGVGNPTLAQDAATKDYVDDILGSATSAATSAAAAATSASNAATSASNAASSATASANSASAAAASYDAFDDRYLGDKASDPTLDNDGNALLTGALYFNTTSDVMKVYDGSAWNIAAISSTSPTFTGTVTADGLSLNSGSTSNLVFNRVSSASPFGGISIQSNLSGTTYYSGEINHFNGDWRIKTQPTSSTDSGLVRMIVGSGGDISFYEDTGTTPKFFWDASAESLGIGTTSPFFTVAGRSSLSVNGTSSSILAFGKGGSSENYILADAGGFTIANTSATLPTRFFNNGAERMRIDSSGNVGIGTVSSAWQTTSNRRALELGFAGNGLYSYGSGNINMSGAAYFDGAWKYASTGISPAYYNQSGGSHSWYTATTGTAGNAISFSEVMRIDSSGNVGIGTSSPDQRLTISGTTTQQIKIIATEDGTDMRVGASSFSSGSGFVGTVSNHPVTFITNNTERMRIDSGNLLIGQSTTVNPAGANISGIGLSSTGYISATRDGDFSANFNRKTSDGTIVQFNKDGSVVGSIGTSGGAVTIGKGITTLKYLDSLDTIHPNGTGSGSDGLTSLGWSNNRFKDLYLGGGVYLGGTVAANQLDDYEEGDYDVTITCGTSGTVTLNSSFNRSQYTKVGRMVHVSGFVAVSSVSSPVGLFTMSLPFTPASLTDRAGDSVVSLVLQNVSSANVSDFVATINEGSAFMHVQLGDATTLQNDSANQLQANTYISFSATYAAA
jgi:hypothetical protein